MALNIGLGKTKEFLKKTSTTLKEIGAKEITVASLKDFGRKFFGKKIQDVVAPAVEESLLHAEEQEIPAIENTMQEEVSAPQMHDETPEKSVDEKVTQIVEDVVGKFSRLLEETTKAHDEKLAAYSSLLDAQKETAQKQSETIERQEKMIAELQELVAKKVQEVTQKDELIQTLEVEKSTLVEENFSYIEANGELQGIIGTVQDELAVAKDELVKKDEEIALLKKQLEEKDTQSPVVQEVEVQDNKILTTDEPYPVQMPEKNSEDWATLIKSFNKRFDEAPSLPPTKPSGGVAVLEKEAPIRDVQNKDKASMTREERELAKKDLDNKLFEKVNTYYKNLRLKNYPEGMELPYIPLDSKLLDMDYIVQAFKRSDIIQELKAKWNVLLDEYEDIFKSITKKTFATDVYTEGEILLQNARERIDAMSNAEQYYAHISYLALDAIIDAQSPGVFEMMYSPQLGKYMDKMNFSK